MINTTNLHAIINQKTGQILVQQPFPPLNCLVLEGGGVRCTAYAGAIKVLEKYHLLPDICYVAGSSAGAIAALVLALGYSSHECNQILSDIPMDKFMERAWADHPSILTKSKHFFTILTSKQHSLSTGNVFLAWVQALVEKKLGVGKQNATFRDLEESIARDMRVNKISYFKRFFTTGTDLSLSIPECKIFSYDTTPDMPLALAVRISSSFPFVFDPVEWNNHKFIDGGLKKNLPTRIFDERKYLPSGYDFTDKGVNPGVLAIKVDTEDEIAQIIWGINKEININSAKEIGGAICNALLESVDSTEIREARMVVPLPDSNIHTLQFMIDPQGRINLVTQAEKVMQEFLENHVDAAYSIKCYSMDDAELLDARIPFSTCVNNEPMGAPPWCKLVKEDMKNKLDAVKQQIAITQIRIKEDLENNHLHHHKEKLHTEPFFGYLQQLIGFQEYLKLLKDEKHDLEIKLNLKHENEHIDKINSAHYEVFAKKMRELKQENISLSLYAIMQTFNLFRPRIAFQSFEVSDNVVFVLDLRNRYDRQIYLIAGALYLENRKSKDERLFIDAYRAIFSGNVLVPKSYAMLSYVLDQAGIELYLSAYRIEELIHYFERIELPQSDPVIDIDHVFGLSSYSMFKTVHKNEENGLKLKNMFSHLLMFEKIKNQIDTDPYDLELIEENTVHLLQANRGNQSRLG